MNGILISKRYFWVVITALLLASFSLSSSPAAPLRTEDATRRADMLSIAERYASYQWTANDDGRNKRHEENVHTPDAETIYGSEDHPTYHPGWWVFESRGVNEGIPYFWGGFTSIGDDPGDGLPDLNLKPGDHGIHFREKIEDGFPAGDVTTEYRDLDDDGALDDQWVAWGQANGVDCVGFVNHAWRTGSRLGMSKTSGYSRPIRFEELRAGDVLLRYERDGLDHVVLFERFVNYEPGSGPPVPENTMFEVYEATLSYGKVHKSTYLLKELVDTQLMWSQDSRYYESDIVRMQRIADGYELGDYHPRTYLNPIDVVLVIDRSGSMSSEGKMGKAKEAAKMFVDLMRTGDKIGVVAFNSSASVIFPLTEIDSAGQVKGDAKYRIDHNIYATGTTSIGGGLQKGHEQLQNTDPVRIMVLLSDGYENYRPFWDTVKGNIISDHIAVHTLGVGSDADQVLLARIASETGGIYRFADANGLRYVFNSLLVKVYGEEVARTASGIVPSGGTVEESVLVDSTMGSTTFSLFWPGSDLDLTLVQPDGRVIDPSVAETDPDISFTSGSTYEFYQVFAPQPGVWTMRIFGESTPADGEDYTISVSGMDAMIFSVDPDKDEYYSGEPIILTASIEESLLDSPTEPEYIHGVAMQVTVEDPALNQYSFDLYDDGLHGDGRTDDGVYANTFSNTSLAGSYNFKVQVSGVNNRDAQPFTREYLLSMVFKAGPIMQVQPTNWQFEYPTQRQTTFQVSEIGGLAGLANVSFTASDLTLVGQPGTTIPASAFTFTPNNFPVQTMSTQDVVASLTVPTGTPQGIYTGEILVTGDSQSVTIATEVTVTSPFPRTPVLDEFDAGLSPHWTGDLQSFSTYNGVLALNWDCYYEPPENICGTMSGNLSWDQVFGSSQEAYVVFATMGSGEDYETTLYLKYYQDPWTTTYLHVTYNNLQGTVTVGTVYNYYYDDSLYLTHGDPIPVTFEPGDQFGARASSNGLMEVYKNGEKIGERSITDSPIYGGGGQIGIGMVYNPDSPPYIGASIESFGGGTITNP